MATKKMATEPKDDGSFAAAVEILKFYANPKSWKARGARPWDSQVRAAWADAGQKARDFLYDRGIKVPGAKS